MRSPSPRTPPAGNARLALVLLTAVLAAAAGFWLSQRLADGFDPAALTAVRVLPRPREISDFRLETGSGTAFGPDQLRGHWTLMYFGFTNCPDVCPTTLFNLAQIIRQLEGEKTVPRVVFVSVDPDRDRGEKLSRYTGYFHPDFTGVTGDEAQLLLLTRQLSVVYTRSAPDAQGNYSVDHTAAVLLLDPDVRLYAVLPAPIQPGIVAAELKALLRNRGGP